MYAHLNSSQYISALPNSAHHFSSQHSTPHLWSPRLFSFHLYSSHRSVSVCVCALTHMCAHVCVWVRGSVCMFICVCSSLTSSAHRLLHQHRASIFSRARSHVRPDASFIYLARSAFASYLVPLTEDHVPFTVLYFSNFTTDLHGSVMPLLLKYRILYCTSV